MNDIFLEQYEEYINDVDIATAAIKEALLYPTEELMFDLYAIPSHNHQAYYAIVVEKNEQYELIYAKTEISYSFFEETVRMYTFADTKEADASSNSVGKIIIGISQINSDFVNMLKKIVSSVPSGKYFYKDTFCLDGVFQSIRSFNLGAPIKEIAYECTQDIPLAPEKEELRSVLDNLYLEVEKIINKNSM